MPVTRAFLLPIGVIVKTRDMSKAVARHFVLAAVASALIACGPPTPPATDGGADAGVDMGPTVDPIFPEDISGWAEARDCRFSHEHELAYIRVLVDPDAEVPYRELSPDHPYPEGATLVKPAYLDEDCTTITGYTAMKKLPIGASPEGNDWRWQRLDADRNVLEDGEIATCITCHRHHCTEPQCGYPDCGYDLTCNEEPPL